MKGWNKIYRDSVWGRSDRTFVQGVNLDCTLASANGKEEGSLVREMFEINVPDGYKRGDETRPGPLSLSPIVGLSSYEDRSSLPNLEARF